MKTFVGLITVFFVFCALVIDIKADDDVYYTRCNLKVIKGSYITWVNWQSVREYLPAGTKVQIEGKGSKVNIYDIDAKRSYILDVGNAGDAYLEKFVTKRPININSLSKEFQSDISQAVARIGMTKEQAYIAMGPPAWITSGNTNNKTYENILSTNLWVYKRKRFGKNIGVEFNSATGLVNKTEGIWR